MAADYTHIAAGARPKVRTVSVGLVTGLLVVMTFVGCDDQPDRPVSTDDAEPPADSDAALALLRDGEPCQSAIECVSDDCRVRTCRVQDAWASDRVSGPVGGPCCLVGQEDGADAPIGVCVDGRCMDDHNSEGPCRMAPPVCTGDPPDAAIQPTR